MNTVLDARSTHPFRRDGLARRTAPFGAALVLAFAVLPLADTGSDTEWILAALAGAAAAVASVVLVPWERLPRWLAIVPPLAFLAVVVCLREGAGGSASGFAPAALLPVLWLSLYGTRVELEVYLVAMAVALATPVLVEGAPEYPEPEWRRIVIILGTAAFMGYVTSRLVGQVRSRARELAGKEAHLRAIMDSAAEGILTLDTRGRVEYVNPAACRILRLEAGDVVGRQLHDQIHHSHADGTPYPASACKIRATLHRGQSQTIDDEVFWRGDGTPVAVEYRSEPIAAADGSVAGVVLTFDDVTKRREVDAMKDQFISVVGHELRTPLTSIRGSLGLLGTGALGQLSDRGRQMVQIAVENSDRLVRLVNDILDLERMETGRVELDRRALDLSDAVGQAVAVIEPLARAAGVEVRVEPIEARVDADPDRLVQVVTNLLSNAVKFSPSDSTVVARALTDARQVTFEVSDRGRGVPPDKLEAIFERFQQVDASDARDKGGTGLGLAIARSIVTAHGGRIWAQNRDGGGTTFRVVLPLLAEVQSDRPRLLVCTTAGATLPAQLEAWGYDLVVAERADDLGAAARASDLIVVDLEAAGSAWPLVERRRDRRPPTAHVVSLLVEGPEDAALAAAVARAHRSGAAGAVVIGDDGERRHRAADAVTRAGLAADAVATVGEAEEAFAAGRPDLVLVGADVAAARPEALAELVARFEPADRPPLVLYAVAGLPADEVRAAVVPLLDAFGRRAVAA